MEFKHIQHAHCESGVTSNLLLHNGILLSEPLVFGIGAGIFFAHLPFAKVSGIPGTAFRVWPGLIFKRVTQRLGIKIHYGKFKNAEIAMQALDAVLAKGIPVGMLSSVYYLDYLPEAFRFHFNAHNLIVYGKQGDQYLVSDPVMGAPTLIGRESLIKARFAKGFPEPKGKMYFIESVPSNLNLDKAIKDGIKRTCFMMLSPPMPWFGLNAIKLLSKKIAQYPKKLTPRQITLYLGNIIRMQEEIGTGGAGFRFLYAAFLQEAAGIINKPELKVFSERYTVIGDLWRAAAYNIARVCKARNTEVVSLDAISEQYLEIYQQEKVFFTDLKKMSKSF